MKPAVLNLELFKGDDYDLTLSFVDQADAPVDLSTRTFVVPVRRFADSRDATLFAVDAADAASGVLRLSLPSTATDLLVSGEWLLQETIGGKRHTILGGRLAVVQEARGVAEGATATVRLAPDVVRIVTTGTTGPAGPSGAGSGPAGGVLAGTYPDPGFAVDMATQAELDAVDAASAKKAANLADLASAAAARTNLGLGSAATHPATDFDAAGAASAAMATAEGYADTGDALRIPLTQKGAANGVATLDGGSKIPTAQLPALAITDTFVVASQAAMLALTAQRGDLAVRSDLPGTFILAADDPTVLANWIQLPIPTDAVLSVNGQTGVVTGLAEQADLTTEATTRGTADTAEANARAAADATRLNWRGAWAATTAYAVNDIFTNNGGLYRVPVAFTSGGAFDATGLVVLVPPSGTYAPASGIAEAAVTGLVADLAGKVPTASNVIAVDPLGLGSVDRGRANGLANVRFDDGTEIVENDWADIATAWTGYSATTMAVAGGQFQSSWDTGEGNALLYRTLAVASSKTLRLIFSFTVAATAAATNSALYSIIGIKASAAAPTDFTNIIGVGVGEKNLPLIFNTTGMTSAQAEQSATPLAAGTYFATITIDENWINLSIIDAARTIEYTQRTARTVLTGSAVNTLVAVNRDSRKATGNTIGAVFAKTNAATARVRSTTTAEGLAPQVGLTRPTSSSTDTLRVEVPAAYDSRNPRPVVIYCHGSGDTATTVGNTVTATLVRGLSGTSYNYLVAAGDFANNGWGNQASLDAFTAAYRYLREHYNIGPVLLLSASMGGLTALNVLARRVVPGVIGWYGMYPATNLAAMYADGVHTAAIETAYGFSGAGAYAAATSGHDPMLYQGWQFRGVPMRMSASAADTVVSKTDNADAFSTLVSPYAPESAVLVGSGAHGDASQVDIADVNTFYQRCLGLA